MRRLLPLLLAFLLLPSMSWAKHLTLMGIPLDGKINAVTTKLRQKGFKIDAASSTIGDDARLFTGTYMGRKCDLFVYFNPASKDVYKAQFCYHFQSETSAANFGLKVMEKFKKEYPNSAIQETSDYDHVGWKFQQLDIDKPVGVRYDGEKIYESIGEIHIFTGYLPYTGEPILHIYLLDVENTNKYQ